nr:hypothetical protein [uncultured Acetatifactor sp.]
MYNNIFVLASFQYQSGGTESEHQLVGWLNDRGSNAYIYYYDQPCINNVPQKYRRYNVKIANVIEDEETNLLIVAETLTEYLYKYKSIKKGIWWLSLNYYLYAFPYEHAKFVARRYCLPLFTAILLQLFFRKSDKKRFVFGEDRNEIIHFYNCEYVKQYLDGKGIDEAHMHYLCGPIRDEYFKIGENLDRTIKEDIILYNPNKGLYFTKLLLLYAKIRKSTYRFVPLINMTSEQVAENMRKAKLYIDFGDFPGPERIPRESVMMRCNLICAKVGSCCNNIDIPIPEKYKITRRFINIPYLYSEIEKGLNNYQFNFEDFDMYRQKVRQQRTDMDQTLKEVFYC